MVQQFTPTADSWQVVYTIGQSEVRLDVVGFLYEPGGAVQPLVAWGDEILRAERAVRRETTNSYSLERV